MMRPWFENATRWVPGMLHGGMVGRINAHRLAAAWVRSYRADRLSALAAAVAQKPGKEVVRWKIQ
jgi:hypothetical protein